MKKRYVAYALALVATLAIAADVKVSGLPAVSSVATTDELLVNNGGTSRKATPVQVVAGSIGSNALINRTSSTVVAAYAGTSCTNQFPRSLSAAGAATCASVSMSADTTGTLPVANGGTGIAVASGGQLQAFLLYIRNNAGTMQHQFVTEGFTWGASNFVGKINAATNSYNTTPTGADASTAMAFGGKIGATSTHYFYLDVAAQTVADSIFMCSMAHNTTTTALIPQPQRESININGVTQIRQRIAFFNATTGAAFPLTTANMSAGQIVAVQCLGVLQ